jgi:hypothetical protein
VKVVFATDVPSVETLVTWLTLMPTLSIELPLVTMMFYVPPAGVAIYQIEFAWSVPLSTAFVAKLPESTSTEVTCVTPAPVAIYTLTIV